MGTPEVIADAIKKTGLLFEKGMEEELSGDEAARVLTTLLFEVTNNTDQRLVEIRDYDTIKEVGPFKYSGQVDTMHEEGLLPDDLFDEFNELGLNRHFGPSYLRVKGLFTDDAIAQFFGKQQAYGIIKYLGENPSSCEGYVMIVPNMTGGAWIGREAKREMVNIAPSEIKMWRATPYARDTRKTIDVVKKEAKIGDSIEGLMPIPEETSAVISFEELRTTSETTRNAQKIFRVFGYGGDSTDNIAACAFDYRHGAGVARLERDGVSQLYLVDGNTFLDVSHEIGYISDSQYKTAKHWLGDHWGFTREMMPTLKELKVQGKL